MTRTLEMLYEEVKACTKCELCKTKINTVFSRGNKEAKLFCTGEAPGKDEQDQGLPFVGASGKLLNKVLTELGLDIDKDIYVANIIKCRPPDNRKPTDIEINCCIDYLEEQLSLINPKVIVALGNTAIQTLTNTAFGITKLHGKFLKHDNIQVLCAYHPSFIIRNGGIGSKMYDEFKQDLQLAINKMNE